MNQIWSPGSGTEQLPRIIALLPVCLSVLAGLTALTEADRDSGNRDGVDEDRDASLHLALRNPESYGLGGRRTPRIGSRPDGAQPVRPHPLHRRTKTATPPCSSHGTSAAAQFAPSRQQERRCSRCAPLLVPPAAPVAIGAPDRGRPEVGEPRGGSTPQVRTRNGPFTSKCCLGSSNALWDSPRTRVARDTLGDRRSPIWGHPERQRLLTAWYCCRSQGQ